MAAAADATTLLPLNNGRPIPCWSDTIVEYDVMGRFPQLMKRFDTGMDCLTVAGAQTTCHIAYLTLYCDCRTFRFAAVS